MSEGGHSKKEYIVIMVVLAVLQIRWGPERKPESSSTSAAPPTRLVPMS